MAGLLVTMAVTLRLVVDAGFEGADVVESG